MVECNVYFLHHSQCQGRDGGDDFIITLEPLCFLIQILPNDCILVALVSSHSPVALMYYSNIKRVATVILVFNLQ